MYYIVFIYSLGAQRIDKYVLPFEFPISDYNKNKTEVLIDTAYKIDRDSPTQLTWIRVMRSFKAKNDSVNQLILSWSIYPLSFCNK